MAGTALGWRCSRKVSSAPPSDWTREQAAFQEGRLPQRPALRMSKEIGGVYAKCPSDPADVVNSHIPLSSLYRPQIGAVDSCALREGLLGPPALKPETADIRPQDCPPIDNPSAWGS